MTVPAAVSPSRYDAKSHGGRRRRVRTAEIMGMIVSVHAIGDAHMPVAEFDAMATAVFADLHAVDALFSPFRPGSQVSAIGRGELRIEDADPDVRQVAEACRIQAERTNGLFSAYWNDVFDPTGYVKGWAVERAAARHLRPLLGRTGVEAVGVNAGGDMQLYTAPGSEWVWRIGIVDPSDRLALLATVEVADGAIATSGTAERGAHIRDPRSGVAARGIVQASVVADGLTEADVLATAACVAGWDLSWLARAQSRMGMIVAPDGRVRRWSGAVEVTTVPRGEGR